MISVISPAKTLDYSQQKVAAKLSKPQLLNDSAALVEELLTYDASKLGKLMSISPKLAELNEQRYQDWQRPFSEKNAKAALLAFKGDVYTGFELDQYQKADYDFAQQKLRILSGLYGVLRPLDLMQPYRLEMGTKLENERGKNLYEFWGSKITKLLKKDLTEHKGASKCLVNLASKEYFDSVKIEELEVPVISPVFKDAKAGTYKIISFYAKKARGMMCDYLIRNKIDKPEGILGFNSAGYRFDSASSSETAPVFLREEQA